VQRAAIAQTERAGAPAPTTLEALKIAWPAIVGAELSRQAQPIAIQGDVLVIRTASADCSKTLAFLEPEILNGLPLPAALNVTGLRFRVAARGPADAALSGVS
jgi:hypothetical protein